MLYNVRLFVKFVKDEWTYAMSRNEPLQAILTTFWWVFGGGLGLVSWLAWFDNSMETSSSLIVSVFRVLSLIFALIPQAYIIGRWCVRRLHRTYIRCQFFQSTGGKSKNRAD